MKAGVTVTPDQAARELMYGQCLVAGIDAQAAVQAARVHPIADVQRLRAAGHALTAVQAITQAVDGKTRPGAGNGRIGRADDVVLCQ